MTSDRLGRKQREILGDECTVTCCQKISLVVMMAWVLVLAGCKPFSKLTGLAGGGTDCLLDQRINSLYIGVAVNHFEKGNVLYNFEFSEAFTIPYLATPQEQVAGSDGSSLIGQFLNKGLKVKDKFHYVAADFITGCHPESYWSNKPYASYHPLVTVEVNERYLFQATFEPQVGDVSEQQNCGSGLRAQRVVLRKAPMAGNPTYEKRRQECR